MEFAIPSQLLDIGAGGLLGLVVLLVLFGYLVPYREMKFWREAFFEQQRISAIQAGTAPATRAVLEALPPALGAPDTPPSSSEGPAG